MEINEPGLRLVGEVATQGKEPVLSCTLYFGLFFFPFLPRFFFLEFFFLLIHYLLLRQYFEALKHRQKGTINLCGIICFKQLLQFTDFLNSSLGKSCLLSF